MQQQERQSTPPVLPGQTAAEAVPERPQPLTPDTIPDPPPAPRAADDTSALTAEEAADYAACEKAIDHYSQATWMYGKALQALQAIRDARYYRQEFPCGLYAAARDHRRADRADGVRH
ncbi:hypothetical protein [Streptomyces sp. NBC_01803]|uniref:hypothetical protein n=1 Tax=Streptomyces sp. NBC_01803 TaxID=2975946 RepID=UPI002DDB3AB4|nr:hypothetical protein [Streptomyces sp. NBC_01803]WSA47450.1 hypothetical protein OIE51_26735 [Streptomyces sp. NBC_01803]